jgi:hypothetical protein
VSGPIFDADHSVTKWRGQIDTLRTALVRVHAHRQMWHEVIEALETRPPEPTLWRSHYTGLYVNGQMMALRRLIRGSRRNHISLAGLLLSISKDPEAITTDFVVSIAAEMTTSKDPIWLDLPREGFERDWGDGSGHLDPGIPREGSRRASERGSYSARLGGSNNRSS